MAVTSENDFAAVVEQILSTRPNGESSYSDLIAEIPNRMTPTADDEEPSKTRPGEPMWHQRVRNITSHKNFRDRFASIPGGLKLIRKAA